MRSIIYYIAKQYRKIEKMNPIKKTGTTKSQLESYRRKDRALNKYLDNVFKQDREEYLSFFESKLEKGRVKHNLGRCYDSLGISYQQQVEQWFLFGWHYEESVLCDGSIYKCLSRGDYTTRGCTNDTSLNYAKFLTNKYGILFVKPKLAV